MEVQEDNNMEQSLYEKTFVNIKPGDVARGKVVQVEPTAVFVDIGEKADGMISLEELSYKPVENAHAAVRVGDELEVYVLGKDEEGVMRLSRKRAELEKTWLRIKEAKEKNSVLQGTIVEQVKGGLVVDLGVRGFIPASHMTTGKFPAKNLDDFIGETLPLKVLDIDQQRGRVVLSHRQAIEQDVKKKREDFWKTIYQGEFRKGTVARFANFGAFVDLGGVDGLVHLSELSWKRVKHPSEVLKIGDKVEVMVLGFDQEKERVSLSLRRALPDPWTQLPDTFSVGSMVDGTITRTAKRYVFVEVYPGVEGLIPLSELGDRKSQDASQDPRVTEGEKVRARIVEFKPEARRLVLSLREPRQGGGSGDDDYRRYLKSETDRPLTLKDILGEKLQTELGG